MIACPAPNGRTLGQVGVDLVAVAVAESGRSAAVAGRSERGDRRCGRDAAAVAGECRRVEVRVIARLAVNPATGIHSPARRIGGVPGCVERRARGVDTTDWVGVQRGYAGVAGTRCTARAG